MTFRRFPLAAWSLAALVLLSASLRVSAATPTLLWSDEFSAGDASDSTAPDSTKWGYELGNNNGWGNNELESYTNSRANSAIVADAAATDGKALAITATSDGSGHYSSARLKTQYTFTTTYGHVEARLKTTSGQGLWPAFWMLGASIGTGTPWPNCGEIDIMEVVNKSPATAYGTAHGPGYSGANGLQGSVTLNSGSFDQAYHVFAVDWSPNQITWSCDGTAYKTITPAQMPAGGTWVFNNSPFFLMLNLAVGGFWPGNPDGTTAFPAKYMVDYVRVYGIPPTTPGSLVPDVSVPSQVTFTWSAPTDLKGFAFTGYVVERATDSGFSQNLVRTSIGNVNTFTDTAVAASTAYYYRLSAVSTGGTSDTTGALAVITGGPPSPTNTIAFGSSTFPATAKRGATVPFSVTVTNTGSNAWGPNHYLTVRDTGGNNLSFASLNGVAAGGSTTVQLSLTAPATAGRYTYSLQAFEQNVMWFANTQAESLTVGAPARDFNGDGQADLIWSNTTTGDRAIWYLNGAAVGTFGYIAGIDPAWHIVGQGDFDGDGKTDLVWENLTSGDRTFWMMNGISIASFGYLANVDGAWHIAAIGDFNGDGQNDVIWENTSTGDRAVWFLTGQSIDSFGYIAGIDPAWHIVGAADFDGDGKTDLVWENLTTGDRTVWFMNGPTLSTLGYIANVPGAWHIAEVADIDGDGNPDLVWENTSTGDRAIWLMNGTNLSSAPYLAFIDPVWKIAP
ncbi:MAG TPA: family 16 glycosylhydrolase [Candidatus Didemnitutus sp.]|nr:family 16 glycosylhydrolase [Candidatus Didemnitutus sp.]